MLLKQAAVGQMTRTLAFLIVLGFAATQTATLACNLLCAVPAAHSLSTGGCHAHSDHAAGVSVTAVPSRCDHEALGPWLTELGQPVPPSATVGRVPTADAAATNAPPSDSIRSPRWVLPESPPSLGSVRSSVLRI